MNLPKPFDTFCVECHAGERKDFGLSPNSTYPLTGVTYPVDYGEIGEHEQLLAWLDIGDRDNLVFRTPDLTGRIEDPAKLSELIQLLAIGEDATSWSLD